MVQYRVATSHVSRFQMFSCFLHLFPLFKSMQKFSSFFLPLSLYFVCKVFLFGELFILRHNLDIESYPHAKRQRWQSHAGMKQFESEKWEMRRGNEYLKCVLKFSEEKILNPKKRWAKKYVKYYEEYEKEEGCVTSKRNLTISDTILGLLVFLLLFFFYFIIMMISST